MTERERERRDAVQDPDLAAYHDGELRGFARWRFERRLRRDPELRRELARLERIRAAVRGAAAGAPDPDLWDRIALRLPAADAARAAAREARRARRLWLVALPVGAAAAAGLAGVALYFRTAPIPGPEEEAAGVVRWMRAGRSSVFVREEAGPQGATIIWLLHDPNETAARRRTGETV